MANVNKVMLLGNLTRDPELRYTPKGTAVTEIGLAINRVRRGENEERIEETTFVDIVLWGRQAELADQYLSKGRALFIEGRLQLDQWDDKDTGQKRQRLRVIGENMQFIGSGQAADSGKPTYSSTSSTRAPASSQPPASPPQGGNDESHDHIPF